jgi:predicted RNA-binding Zn-ribbon protein involved in translation (DUF1610 family)
MPKGKKTQTNFTKALRSPGQRKSPGASMAFRSKMRKPEPRSEIVDYVETKREEETDKSTTELVHEFQEECKHTKTRIVVGQSPTKRFLKCPDCGDIKTVEAKVH